MRCTDPRTYRATTEAWLGQLLLPLLFFLVLTVTAIRTAGLDSWVGGLGMLVLMAVAGLDYMLPMLRNWLKVDAQRLEGCINGHYLYIYWNDVLAAWQAERKRQPYLCVGTREGTLVIPLRFLDAQAVWEQVQPLVPPEALEDGALRRLPDYQEWAATRDAELGDVTSPRPVADHWLIQAAGWFCLTLFLAGAIAGFGAGFAIAPAMLLALALLCGLALLNWGISEFSAEGIDRYTLFGGWTMRWDDVRWIEVDPFEAVIVLVGDGRQMVVPGPKLWSGGGKKAALALLLQLTEHRRIPIRRTPLALFRLSRYTRIKK